jgi:probable addiction module antidote protein
MAKTKTTARKYPTTISHEEVTIRMFREDPEFAAEYLNQVLEDGNQEELMLAMRRIADAFGGVSELAKRTNLHAKTLYRTLSRKGNPELRSLNALFKAMGMRIVVAPLPPSKSTRRQQLKVA